MVGGLTAVATATGGFAAMAHVAPAGAGQDSAGPALGAAGAVGAGTFESCDAYFGFGKEAEALGVVDFSVFDLNGDDDTAHAVPTDTTVRLVLENEEGEELECIPFEITPDMWADMWDGEYDIPPFPAYPGAGHYAYPSVSLGPGVPGFGDIAAVGFRVVTIPGSEHTLVAPQGVQPLEDHYLGSEDLFFFDIVDDRVAEYVASTPAGAEGAAAVEEVAAECGPDGEGNFDPEDADLIAAANELADLIGFDGDYEFVGCFDMAELHFGASLLFSAEASVDYTEEITLSLPEDPTVTPPVAPPAVAPVAQPSFTG